MEANLDLNLTEDELIMPNTMEVSLNELVRHLNLPISTSFINIVLLSSNVLSEAFARLAPYSVTR